MARFSMFGQPSSAIKPEAPKQEVAPPPQNLSDPIRPFVGKKEVQKRAMDWAGGGLSDTPNPITGQQQPQATLPIPENAYPGMVSRTPNPVQPIPQNEYEKTQAQIQGFRNPVQPMPPPVNGLVPAPAQPLPGNSLPGAPIQGPPIPQPRLTQPQNPMQNSSLVNNLMGYGGMPQGVQRNPIRSIFQPTEFQ